MKNSMNHFAVIDSEMKELERQVSNLLKSCSAPPSWMPEFGWRHPEKSREIVLFWLLKLAAITSTINAAIILAKKGYWYQVGILARSITDANLSIIYTLPRPDMKPGSWPNEKQLDAVKTFFKETWEDPNAPFIDRQKRSHIRNLPGSIGHLQVNDSTLNQHDASQIAKQSMRFLSDFTHMAYPQIMELYSGDVEYRLEENQRGSSYGPIEFGRLVSNSFSSFLTVCHLIKKNIEFKKDETASSASDNFYQLSMLLEEIELIESKVEMSHKKIESVFSASELEVKNLLKSYKTGIPINK